MTFPTVSGKSFKIPWFQSPPSRNFKGNFHVLPQRIMASSFPMHAFPDISPTFPRSISALRGPRQSSTKCWCQAADPTDSPAEKANSHGRWVMVMVDEAYDPTNDK